MMENNTFEQSLKDLENIVLELEKGEMSLDDSIKNFEKGIELSRECSKKLEEAEKKINVLVSTENGVEEKTFAVTE